MPSSREYLEYILEKLSCVDDITFRQMMGEYIIYYKGKVVGGIYDDRFLIKETKEVVNIIGDAEKEVPYKGAKEMIVLDDTFDKDYLRKIFDTLYESLPAKKQ